MSALALLADSPGLFIGTCFVLGLAIGSFLNVVIYRLPVMLERQWRAECAGLEGGSTTTHVSSEPPFNLVVPRSTCPHCKAPIGALENIPLISWLVLRGRCRHCRAPISVRYPLVECLTGILSAIVAWHFEFGWGAAAGLVLTWFLIALAFIDIDHQLLPDSLTLPLLWLGLLVSLLGTPVPGAAIPVSLPASVTGAMGGYVSLWSVYHLFRLVTGKEGMGYGDFKLFAALGAWLGWQMLLPVILIAAVVGAVTGIATLTLRRQHRGTPIPFGPFLAAAGWLMLLQGPGLVGRYLSLYHS